MKKLILAAACGVLLGSTVVAFAKIEHPNLQAAYDDILKAEKSLAAAEKANEYDLGGHAAKARDLLKQADGEIAQAVKTANEHEKKK
ncbi:MAG TPA: hypothetical protein VKT74_03680 [Gammaproteobacteria bacterium]|nr:hypothetical protein [Gammaproteobacteria bacterium]